MKIKILWKDRKDLGLLVLGPGGVDIYSLSIPLNTILRARAAPGTPPEDSGRPRPQAAWGRKPGLRGRPRRCESSP